MRRKRVVVLLLGVFLPLLGASASQQPKITESRLEVIGHVSWWTDGGAGPPGPALGLVIENKSQEDLGYAKLKFQTRFTEVGAGYVVVANARLSPKPFLPGERAELIFKGPSSAFLHPDKKIECKVMDRAGNAEGLDSETFTLFITPLSDVTMTDEQAAGDLSTFLAPTYHPATVAK